MDFSVLIKPASSMCNLKCSYCFYDDISNLRSKKSYGMMKKDTAEMLIKRAIEHIDGKGNLHFSFQGGEPTLAGLGFFKAFAEYAKKIKTEKINYTYTIQTNGTLIDELWCEFFKEYDFLVGLSFDGTADIHDYLRKDSVGKPTSKKVLYALKLFKQYKIEYNVLAVITKQVAAHPKKVYKSLKRYGFNYIQFIPCLPPLEEESCLPYTLKPKDYFSFLTQVFNSWYDDIISNEYTSVRLFDNLTRLIGGFVPEQCGILGTCSMQNVVEADGSVYCCDFYAVDDYMAGNITEMSFKDLAESQNSQSFLNENKDNSDNYICNSCKMKSICGGGCKRYRSFYLSEGDFCPYREFLYLSYEKLCRINNMLRHRF